MQATAWINSEEAAARLGVTRVTISRLVRQRELPALRVGRVYRFDPQAVEAYIEENTTAPEPTTAVPRPPQFIMPKGPEERKRVFALVGAAVTEAAGDLVRFVEILEAAGVEVVT